MAASSKKTAQSTKIGNDDQLPQKAQQNNQKKPELLPVTSPATEPKERKSRFTVN